jgi:hypothetical protein
VLKSENLHLSTYVKMGSRLPSAAPAPPPRPPRPQASSSGASEAAWQRAQLERARVCWRWVVVHVSGTARPELTWNVDSPLFGHSHTVGGEGRRVG